MKMKMFIVAALAMFSLGATAQRTERVIDRIDQRTVQEFDHTETTQSFKSHWFLTVQGGAQYTLGEAKFSKLISPNVQLGLGYQFSPVFGMRLQANGWQSKGAWDGHRTVKGNTPFTADYKYKYVAPGLDFMFNLSNLFCGWNPDRVFNVTLFLGGGANIAFDNDEVNNIASVVQNLDQYNLEYLWSGTKVNPYGRATVFSCCLRVMPTLSLTSTTRRRLKTLTGTSTLWLVCASTWVRFATSTATTLLVT